MLCVRNRRCIPLFGRQRPTHRLPRVVHAHGRQVELLLRGGELLADIGRKLLAEHLMHDSHVIARVVSGHFILMCVTLAENMLVVAALVDGRAYR